MATSWVFIASWFPSAVAIFGNGLIIFMIISKTSLHTLPNGFVISLAMADFAVGFMYFPIYFFCGKLAICEHSFGYGYDLAVLAIYSSVTNLCAMSIDRYIAIVKPLRYVAWMSSRRAAFLVALAWIIPLALDFIPALCTRLGKCNLRNKALISSKMILLEIVPCLFLLIITIQIMLTARKHWWQNARLRAQLRIPLAYRRRYREISTAMVIITVLVVFLACYCVELFSVVRFLLISSTPTLEVFHVITFLIIVNSAANPIAYAMFKRDIRKEFRSFCRHSGRFRPADATQHSSTAV